MSLPLNNLARTFLNIPLKTFIKEQSDNDVKNEKKSKFKLEFDADEAKIAYDEIISNKSQRKSILPKCNTINEKQKSKSSDKVKYVDTPNTSVKNINDLFKAIELGDVSLVGQHLNSENVDICDQFGWTPLMSASYSGHVQIVELLLKLKANTKLLDKSGYTATDLALKKNYLDIVDLIKQYSHKSKRKKIIGKQEYQQNNNKEMDEKGFYCEVCKIFFMESSRSKHESSTLHIFNTGPKLKNAYYGISKHNKGYQMLLSNGWNEETGLGPSGKGQKYPVKTVLKRDRKGLGQLQKSIAKITHFNQRDTDAVKYVNKSRKKYTKKEWEKQIKRDVAKTKILRQALS